MGAILIETIVLTVPCKMSRALPKHLQEEDLLHYLLCNQSSGLPTQDLSSEALVSFYFAGKGSSSGHVVGYVLAAECFHCCGQTWAPPSLQRGYVLHV